ncbi:MAG: hypothetical protein HZA90_28190 [Verrucomicrobia bacterium]|nr:hypothetical protein [Verrucomicrobiota bacterium]
MAKILATTFGAVISLFGLVGFASPTLFGALCTPLHNLLHLLAGAAVVYVAQKQGPSALFWATMGVGGFFLVTGILGVVVGHPGTPTMAGVAPDERLLVVIPRVLELSSSDHYLNLFFGIALITAGVVSAAESPFRLRK